MLGERCCHLNLLVDEANVTPGQNRGFSQIRKAYKRKMPAPVRNKSHFRGKNLS